MGETETRRVRNPAVPVSPFLRFLAALIFALPFSTVVAQTTNLSINATTHRLSQHSLKIPSGGTLTIESGGTLDIGAATITWPATIVLTTGSYANPSWLTGLAWSKISSTPTTLSGYGITDASPLVGSVSLVTAGTIATGTWNATAIASNKIAAALTSHTYEGLTITSTTGTLTIGAGQTLTVPTGGTLVASAFSDTTNAANISSGTLPAARLAAGAKFIARASADQTFASGVATKMTLNTALTNVGGYFDPTNSRWAPPAGFYYIGLAMRCDPSGNYLAYVGKNGSTFWSFSYQAGGAVSGGILVQANGTDYFEFWITDNGGTNQIYTSDSQGFAFGFALP